MVFMQAATLPPLIPLPQPHAVSVDDLEYTRHAGEPMLARVYRPVDAAPFTAMVDVHGGAWVLGDRTQHQALDQALAAHGVLVASVDFRQPPGNPYPTSLVDVNLAIRWLKSQLSAFGVAEGAKVGAFGGSSGGHVAILAAMRPHDPRYASAPLAGHDATLDFVVADAPVTDPHARFLNAQASGRTDVMERHALYWANAGDDVDGNPNLILERGEQVSLPPLFVSQGTADQNVPIDGTRTFVQRYAESGGEVEFHEFEGLGHGFLLYEPARPEAIRQAELVIDFVRRHSSNTGAT
jgi:acetyl esterase/lipase